jgi:tetratricopeptide (TPR) repeat protein
VREAAYATLTEEDRALGHRLAGEWLERTASTDAATLAEHFQRGAVPQRAIRWYCRAAEQALEANELTAAVEQAERAVACGATGEDLGLLRLCEAEANVWLGALGRAEERATEATALLTPGSAAWFRALTQVVTAAGKLTAFDRVEAAVERVVAATGDAPGPRLACLAVAAFSLILGGRYPAADALLATIAGAARDRGALDQLTAALIDQARAARFLSEGDSAESLAAFESALAAFDAAGDRRNACNVRVNVGFMRAELGGFQAADEALRAVLADADRMGLHDVGLSALHNLGHVVAHCGQLDEARALELRAAESLERLGDFRLGGSARSYLATIALLSGDPVTAEREARAAIRLLDGVPPMRVAAVANLARALLAQGRSADALPIAVEAYDSLTTLGQIEEGESLVRLVYAEALYAAGRREDYVAAIRAAGDALRARAAKISDPEWRGRFLTAIPDNARTLALAAAAS